MSITIFCCYAPEDKEFQIDLEKWLKPLKRSGQVKVWSERQIVGGANWAHEIEEHLREAAIILLLLSTDFLASDHCYDLQQQAMDLRKTRKNLSLIPIIIRPVAWELSGLSDFQPLPKDKRPISSSEDKDEVWLQVSRSIKEVVDLLLSQPQEDSVTSEGFLFIGQYAVNGYRWDDNLRPAPGHREQGTMPDAPWLVSRPVGILETSHRYSIFEEKNILREFTSLSPTPEAIQQFANRYGLLLGDADLVPLFYPDGKPDNNLWYGEPLLFWKKEIRDLHVLVALWEMIKDKQVDSLKKHIFWRQDPKSVIFQWQYPNISLPKMSVIASEKLPLEDEEVEDEEVEDEKSPELFYQWKRGEVIRPALHYLRRQINERIEGHISPRLFLSEENKVSMVPDCLRSALYMLLALEVKDQSIAPE